MRRRNFLLLAGGGVLVAGAGSAGAFVATRDPTSARRPWRIAEAPVSDDVRLQALGYAILAPNPHNRQPWIADVRTPGEVVLRVDRERMLPHTDPYNRQIVIGQGCFLELMTLAANARGHAVSLELFPDGEDPRGLTDGRIAVARFRPDATVTADPLFAHVLERRSTKTPYDLARPVPPAALTRLLAAGRHGSRISGTADPARVEALRDLTAAALRVEIETPRTYQESVDLFRIGKAEIERNPDGIDFSGALYETLAAVGAFDRETLADPGSFAYREGLKAVETNARTAMGHVWLTTAGNARADQIAAGRDWVRVNLAATAAGLALHPLSQALQEYPEMAALRADAQARLAPEGGTVQMLGRLGYARPVPPSPRWPLERKLVTD